MVRRVHESPANHDHNQDDRDFRDNNEAVDERRLACAADEQPGQHQENTDGGNIDNPVNTGVRAHAHLKRRMAPNVRNVEAHELEDPIEVLAPSDGDGSRADCVLKHQVPANDPRNQLAHGCVGIGVRAAGHWDHRSKLRVAESGKRAAQS